MLRIVFAVLVGVLALVVARRRPPSLVGHWNATAPHYDYGQAIRCDVDLQLPLS